MLLPLVLPLVLPLMWPLRAAAGEYRYTVLDFPGASATYVFALNDRRQMAGAEVDALGFTHALAGSTAGLATLDPTGPIGTATQSWAFSINHGGDIAGAYQDALGTLHGYVLPAGGAPQTVEFPQASGTQAYGINDQGHVIGVYTDSTGALHAFTLRDGEYCNADAAGAYQTVPFSINNDDEIAGEYAVGADTLGDGYLERQGGGVRLFSAPGAQPLQSYFISINNRGDVLGTDVDTSGQDVNFLRHGLRYETFDLPSALGATLVSAQTVNDFGDIVGYFTDGTGISHGFFASCLARCIGGTADGEAPGAGGLNPKRTLNPN